MRKFLKRCDCTAAKKNKTMKRLLFGILFSSMCSIVFGKDYRISSAAELSTLQLKPGDKVILKDGEWKDQQLVFKGTGTEKLPIILTPEKPGQIKLTGNSTLKIDGAWLVVDGLFFTDGYSSGNDVVRFSPQSENCRLTNSAVVNYNHPDKKVDYKWVSVFGHHNRVDHCWLEGKTHQGTTLVIWLDGTANYDLIDHNYFGQRPELGVNGGETIRIGTSTWSFYDSYTTVEQNIFDHCDGEIEIVSNKSCKNTIRNNLFFECAGTLTLRHGKDAEVYGNYFIGNGLPGTGGVRIICENHKVHNNYFQGLTGSGLSAAISIMDGLPDPQLTSHWQVKNAQVFDNVIVDCKEALCVGAGKNADRFLKAENSSFTHNIISIAQQAIHWVDDSVQLRFQDNTAWNAPDAGKLPFGFVNKDPQLQKDKNNLYHVESNKPADPFWKKEKIGPAWLVNKGEIVIK
jgi:poly(beta-D-mannuronate) lyase